jgi:hypothetical protein
MAIAPTMPPAPSNTPAPANTLPMRVLTAVPATDPNLPVDLMPPPRADQRHDTSNGGTPAGRRLDVESPLQGVDPISQIAQTGSPGAICGVEASAVVSGVEVELIGSGPQRNVGRARLSMLDHVLEGLQHREIHRRLHLGREPAQPGGMDGDRQGERLQLRGQRRS